MASSDNISKLLAQCRSSEIDVKVEALGKLQLEFEGATELAEVDEVISVLKTCIRTPHQHLTAAASATLPSFFHLITAHILPTPRQGEPSTSSSPSGDPHALHNFRQALLAFLPAGGLIDRLGESRERPRELAREALITIAGIAFKIGGLSPLGVGSGFKGKDTAKGQEPPISIVERHIKDLGLGSKVFRVREQTLICLVRIRQDYPSFPIRPYLHSLVELLEDSDGMVRDCARSSVISLFTGPQVTDAARADLKNEMTKKGVRKGIVNDILTKLLSGSMEASLTEKDLDVSTRKPLMGRSVTTSTLSRTVSSASIAGERPPSSAELTPPQSVDILPVYVASAKDMEHEFTKMAPAFEGKETEHNWLLREEAVIRIRGMLRGDAHIRFPDAFFIGLKEGMLQKTLKALQSLRTTVATHATQLYGELAVAMTTSFDPLVETVLTHLLKVAGYTKRIIAQQTQAAVGQILRNTSCQPRLVIPLIYQYLQDKTVQTRQYMIVHVRTILEVHGQKSRHSIESSGGLDLLDQCVRKGVSDANAAVREQARLCFWEFDALWPNNARAISATLDGTAKKLLDKANPNPGAGSSAGGESVTATPASKKSSVAAAIAASRARAKIIATAPPSLRHAATSGAASAAAAAAAAGNGQGSPPRRAVSPSRTLRRTTSPAATDRQAPKVTSQVNGSGGLASPPASRSTSPSAPNPNARHVRPSLGLSRSTNSTVPMPIPPRTAPLSPSPPSSPTPASSAAIRRRISSPLTTSTVGRSLSPTKKAPLHQLARSISPTKGMNGSVRAASASVTTGVRRAPAPSLASSGQWPSECFLDGGVDLLRASHVPLPSDSDDEGDQSLNLMSFSSVYEKFGPGERDRDSDSDDNRRSSTRTPTTRSPAKNGVADSVIHDNLRAQAQQAESAAAQLLELVHDDLPEDGSTLGDSATTPAASPSRTPLPPARMNSLSQGGSSSKTAGSGRRTASSSTASSLNVPTSDSRSSALFYSGGKQPLPLTPRGKGSSLASLVNGFQNSPAPDQLSPSLSSALFERNDKTGTWWKARRRFTNEQPSAPVDESALRSLISDLETGVATVEQLQQLIRICARNPCNSLPPSSPPCSSSQNGMLTPTTPSLMGGFQASLDSVWEGGKAFEALLKALLAYLDASKSDAQLDHGLMLLLEMVLQQEAFMTGYESSLFTFLFDIRYVDKLNVYEATNAIRDALIERTDPVFGLTTVHRNLADFLKQPLQNPTLTDARTSSCCFGLVAMAKFMLLLPPEVLEDELPRIKGSLMTALGDQTAAVIREAGYVAIIAAQTKLRDETHLFALLGGLSETQKHLLTYEFEKLKARGRLSSSSSETNGGLQKLAGKMRHLDALPVRSSPTAALSLF